MSEPAHLDQLTRVCGLAEIPEEGALRVEVAGRPVCVARSAGQVYAVSDICSHADVSLAEGEVADGQVECWLHGSRFDLATGQPLGLPATKPIATYPVTVEGDDVLVQMES
ncbi:MAG: non-heme iron oxygenase ferredoxin subunit [Actinomycetota bacterium]|nr:non-heme iron oxygenase ferredoxin subunit [Actinomycetota bacterium]